MEYCVQHGTLCDDEYTNASCDAHVVDITGILAALSVSQTEEITIPLKTPSDTASGTYWRSPPSRQYGYGYQLPFYNEPGRPRGPLGILVNLLAEWCGFDISGVNRRRKEGLQNPSRVGNRRQSPQG